MKPPSEEIYRIGTCALSRLESDLDAVEAELDEAFELSVLVDEGWEDVDDEKLYGIGA